MRTDKELLELAAKAAGFVEIDFLAKDHWANVYDSEGRQSAWNPLTDDGDALRLAVKLRIALYLELPSAVRIGPRMDSPDYWLDDDEDEMQATRRAIVCAAAAIGAQVAEPAHNEKGDGNG